MTKCNQLVINVEIHLHIKYFKLERKDNMKPEKLIATLQGIINTLSENDEVDVRIVNQFDSDEGIGYHNSLDNVYLDEDENGKYIVLESDTI